MLSLWELYIFGVLLWLTYFLFYVHLRISSIAHSWLDYFSLYNTFGSSLMHLFSVVCSLFTTSFWVGVLVPFNPFFLFVISSLYQNRCEPSLLTPFLFLRLLLGYSCHWDMILAFKRESNWRNIRVFFHSVSLVGKYVFWVLLEHVLCTNYKDIVCPHH